MITMYGFIPASGLPDVSPYVSKTDCFLRLAGIPFKLETLHQADLTKTPKGKLPVIDDDGTIVSDTALIELTKIIFLAISRRRSMRRCMRI